MKKREVSHSRWLDQRTIDDSAQLHQWQMPTIVEREYQSCSLEILFLQGKTDNVDPLYRI